jgi:ferrous iron transport protein A
VAEIRLRDVPIGGLARVVGIDKSQRSYRAKLLSMGLTRGVPVFVQNRAPMGDPIHISVRDFDLSLRRDEADALRLEILNEDPESYGFRPRFSRGRGKARESRGKTA